jgi:UDP:flavonoid glycosyltransferase YjiC (YdhE family)
MTQPKRTLVFAPCAFNLAETSRMVEIAKAVACDPVASKVFDVHFISDGGEFESMIEKHGFALTRMEPRLTAEKIEHIARVDRGEKFTPAFTDAEMIERVQNEIAVLKKLDPVAVITGSYPSIPVTCRVLKVSLVWVVQSTWLPEFFERGAGMTDRLRPAPVKALADRLVYAFISFWIRHGFLNTVNRAAKHFGVPGYKSIFDYWRGDITLVAEPLGFSGAKLPPNHFFIGPLVPQDEFALPEAIRNIPRDRPLIYFAMGSSGTPEIVARIIESFEDKPYRVIAPVKFQLEQAPVAHVPSNVLVTDWVPASEVNKMADLAVIHGGIGTVMTAALAGKPVVGVGMQMEQVANLACLVRLGFAIRVPKSKDPSGKVLAAMSRFGDSVGPKSQRPKFKSIDERLAETRWLDHLESPNRPGFFRARVGQTAGGEYFSRPLLKRRPRARASMAPICLQPFPRRPGLLDAEVGVRVVHYRIEPALSLCFSKARFGDPLLKRFPGGKILWFLSAPTLQEAGASRMQLGPHDLWNLFRSFRDDTNPQNDHVPFRKTCCCFVQPLPRNAEGLLQGALLAIEPDVGYEVCGFYFHRPRPVSGGGCLDCRSKLLYFTNSPAGSERRNDRCHLAAAATGRTQHREQRVSLPAKTFASVLPPPGA